MYKFNSMTRVQRSNRGGSLQLSSRGPELEATDGGDRKGLLYEATLFVNTWEGAVGALTHASIHASCSPSSESSPLLCQVRHCNHRSRWQTMPTVVLLGLEAVFWLKIPGHGSTCTKNFVLKYFIVSNYQLPKIFRKFNFHRPPSLRKYFNYERFPDYGTHMYMCIIEYLLFCALCSITVSTHSSFPISGSGLVWVL